MLQQIIYIWVSKSLTFQEWSFLVSWSILHVQGLWKGKINAGVIEFVENNPEEEKEKTMAWSGESLR